MTRQSLAEHILSEIARCCGDQLPVRRQDKILDGFWERYGARGMDICRRAFGAHNGIWRGAPVTVQRFDEAQDPFFAIPLLAETGATGDDTR